MRGMGAWTDAARKGREPEEIRAIVERWLSRNQVSRRLGEEGIYRRWPEVVGEEIAARTRVLRCAGGVLTVEVASAPLLQELSAYHRESILASIRAREDLQGIREIRFRAGGGDRAVGKE